MKENLYRGQWIKNSDWIEGRFEIYKGVHYIVIEDSEDWDGEEWFQVYPDSIELCG